MSNRNRTRTARADRNVEFNISVWDANGAFDAFRSSTVTAQHAGSVGGAEGMAKRRAERIRAEGLRVEIMRRDYATDEGVAVAF